MNNTQSTELVFELSKPGRRCHRLPASDVPARPLGELIPREHLADAPPPLPEVGEIDLMRHYTNLSARNMSIDTNFYPLGSCTMKYNPKRHERLAALPGFANLHPLQDDDTTQGVLELLCEMQEFLAEISGLPAVSLQPAARRRRARLGPRRGARLPRPIPAFAIGREGRRPLPAELRHAQEYRPRAELLRQRRHPLPRVLLHPHARPGRPQGGERAGGAEREL